MRDRFNTEGVPTDTACLGANTYFHGSHSYKEVTIHQEPALLCVLHEKYWGTKYLRVSREGKKNHEHFKTKIKHATLKVVVPPKRGRLPCFLCDT